MAATGANQVMEQMDTEEMDTGNARDCCCICAVKVMKKQAAFSWEQYIKEAIKERGELFQQRLGSSHL